MYVRAFRGCVLLATACLGLAACGTGKAAGRGPGTAGPVSAGSRAAPAPPAASASAASASPSGQASSPGPASSPDAPAAASSAPASAAPAPPAGTPHAVFVTDLGRIVVRLDRAAAPKAVENFIGLASGRSAWTDPAAGLQVQRPLYDGTAFHRVIADFMIQGGDPSGTGRGGPGFTLEEDAPRANPMARPGMLGMANEGPAASGSQFFITTAPAPWLSGKHVVFGEVIEGLEVADAISRVARASDGSDRPLAPVLLRKVLIEER